MASIELLYLRTQIEPSIDTSHNIQSYHIPSIPHLIVGVSLCHVFTLDAHTSTSCKPSHMKPGLPAKCHAFAPKFVHLSISFPVHFSFTQYAPVTPIWALH
mmetsp:Transcript_31066/g.53103  ORF Transcript_31066/g.53103 Transcript_31066/m.53103 type:complete len:101 (+) Transcript_31066:321-623(+)